MAPGVVWVVLAAAAVLLWGVPTASGQNMQKPRLVPDRGQVILQPGDTLRVTCQADRPVSWNVTSLASNSSRRVITTDNVDTDGEYSHTSHLEIRDVMYLDVGYQSCHFAGASGSEHTASVYLFVNDTENLLVSRDRFMAVTLSQNRRGVIPCRPSHPGVKVTMQPTPQGLDFTWDERLGFVISKVEGELGMLYKCVADDNAQKTLRVLIHVSFDPTEGFVVPSPSVFLAGRSVCTARLGTVTHKLHVFVGFNSATDSVHQPSIDDLDARRNAVLGFTFNLVCSVHKEPGQLIDFSWEVPPASTGLKTGRIVKKNSNVSPTHGNQFISRLVVTDTRPEDGGNYTCRVEDHNGHTNQRSVHVTVYSPNVSSVYLRTDMRSFPMHLGDPIKIVVNVESRPAAEIVWFSPEDKEIFTDSKYSVTETTDQTILEIADLRLEDMGQYRVEATASSDTSTATDQLTFNVTVRDMARVQLVPGESYHVAGERYRISCVATGYPPPSLEWRFEPCTSSLQCPPDAGQHYEVVLSNGELETQVQSSPYRVESDLDVTANQSGVYWCYANNSLSDKPAVAEHRFFVSDIVGGFGIERSNATVIEGDKVTMVCGGSALDFPGPSSLDWQWSRTDTGASQPATDLPGVRVLDETTQYSYRKVLLMDPVQVQHAGLLICSGTDVRDELRRSSTWLGVTASEKPGFTAASNMRKSASLQLEEGDRVVLNCTVTGQPTPDITWTKDGAPLHLEDSDRVALLDGGQRLEIATVLNSDAGDYACRASNREGTVEGSAVLLVPEDDAMIQVVVPLTVVLSLMLVGLIGCLVWKNKQGKGLKKKLSAMELEAFKKGNVEQINPDLPIDEQAELLPYAHDEWEFPKDRLILGRQIGSGAFGRVLKAEAIGLTAGQQSTVVAVKMPRSGSDPDQIRSLMSELKIMIQLGKHLNVVNLLGAVTKHATHGEFMVLVEYCRHGNLHQYLHRHKNSFINQVHPITGEFDATLGEEEFRAAVTRDSTSESTPLQYACLEHRSDGQLTVTPGRSFYRAPRRGSTASSVHSATWDSTDPTGGEDSVCQSPGALDEERVRFNTMSSAGGMSGTTSRRPRRTPLTTRDLLRWSYQVARGMEYLSSRKLLHGDLAARNILLAEDNIVKISDFGLSRDIYKTKDYRKKGKGLLPVKWMAIESIQESLFSTQSDVWAFGVVLWELFSLGATPYPGMEYDVNFVRRLRDGYRMEAPKFSPHSTYELMLGCWRETPSSRPSFTELSERLGHRLEEHVRKDYIQLNEPYQAMNAEYFTRRVDYVNTLVSPDYQNVTPRGEPAGASSERGSTGSRGSEEDITVWPELEAVGYTAPVKGGGPTPLVDSDSYLLMSPGPESSDENVFSPRPGGAAPRPGAHFEFPPPPQLARESPPPPPGAASPSEFYNPSYHEAGRGRVPSTPKMGTRVSRPARPATAGAAAAEGTSDEHYRVPSSAQSVESRADPDGIEQHHLPPTEAGGAHYRVPMPVGCEQLA